MIRTLHRCALAALLALTLLGSPSLQQAAPGAAAQLDTYDTFLPWVSLWNLPPMVNLYSASIAVGGSPQTALLPGQAIQYTTAGSNPNYLAASVQRRWLQDGPSSAPGPCGDGQLFSNTLNLPPGPWQEPVPAAAPSCYGIYSATAQISNGVQTQALSASYVVNPPSQVILETRQAFDRCTLPTLQQMLAWWELSPYWVFNIYIGGSMFYCQDDIPDAAWVHAAANMGWSFILTWVGPQAPCTEFRFRLSSNTATAHSQGRGEADLAVAAARRMGFLGDMAIYYDMEGYGYNASSGCRAAVDAFIDGWSERLTELGVVPGGYGSPATSHIADWANNTPPPDQVWIAHWLSPAQYRQSATTDSSYLSDSLWANHQRLRQYAGGHAEEWGNVTLIIDSSAVDGAVTCIPLPGAVCGQNPWPLSGPSAKPNALPSAAVQVAEQLTPDWGWRISEDRLSVTADGGASWQDVTPPEAAGSPLLAAEFSDPQRGWLARLADGSVEVLRTADGGLSWEASAVPVDGLPALVGGASLEFIDAGTGWLALRLQSGASFSRGALFATQDSGRTWQPRSLPLGEPVSFRDALHGWTAGGPDGAQLYATQDGGLTWQPQTLELPPGAPPARLTISLPQVAADGTATLSVTLTTPDGASQTFLYHSPSGVDWQ